MSRRRISIQRASNQAFVEADNRGTRHDTQKSSRGYWTARAIGGFGDPFIVYEFSTMGAARRAMLGVPCIHVATDSGKTISTEPVEFGCYRADDGKFIAMVCGRGLTRELFEQAQVSFKEQGGSHRNAGERPPGPEPKATRSGDDECADYRVRFHRTYRTLDFTHHVYRAKSRAAALRFLSTKPVKEPLTYLVVETPEGEFGRDSGGMYVHPYKR